MIKNFSKFNSINENNNNDLKIGDYVFMMYKNAFWNESYGEIVNVGRLKNSPNRLVYCIKFLSEIPNDAFANDFFIDHYKKTKETESDIILELDRETKKYEVWFCSDYIVKYTKEEFDRKVEKIRLEKDAKKYNL